MQEEKNLKIREHMLDYLVSLMDDDTDFSWGAAKASQTVLLCRMEQGEIQYYSQIDKIDRIRRANAQKHVQPAGFKNVKNDKKSFTKITKSMPCLYYNQNSCTHKKHMRQRACHTNTYVHHVLPYLARLLPILRVNVGIKIVY